MLPGSVAALQCGARVFSSWFPVTLWVQVSSNPIRGCSSVRFLVAITLGSCEHIHISPSLGYPQKFLFSATHPASTSAGDPLTDSASFPALAGDRPTIEPPAFWNARRWHLNQGWGLRNTASATPATTLRRQRSVPHGSGEHILLPPTPNSVCGTPFGNPLNDVLLPILTPYVSLGSGLATLDGKPEGRVAGFPTRHPFSLPAFSVTP